MKGNSKTTIVVRHSLFTAFGAALLAAIALFTAAPWASAQDNSVTISAGDFQRMVYSAHLQSRLALKPELGACLQVLLEMQRRNPNANPAALAALSSNTLQFYRINAPYYIRTNGYPDEILAAYLDALRQMPARTNFIPINLTMLNCFTLNEAEKDYFTNDTVLALINSDEQRLFSSVGQVSKRQDLVSNCVARAQANAAFASAMDSLLLPETQVSLADTPAEIIGNTNSPLSISPTMQALLALSDASTNGSLTVSSNQLITLFGTEMQRIWQTINTNLAALSQINQSHPDYLAYLTNQAAVDANVRLQAEVQQGQPAQIASATAAVLVQSQLLAVNKTNAGAAGDIEAGVKSGCELALGLAQLWLGQISSITTLMSGGLDIFNLVSPTAGIPTQQGVMTAQLSNIQTLVGDLSTNVNYRFDRVDESLTTIFDTLKEQFSNVDITLDTLQGSIYDIRSSLVDVQSSLDRIEAEDFAGFTDVLHQDMDGDIDGDLLYRVQFPTRPPLSESAYDASPLGPEGEFYTYATEYAAYNTVSPTNFSVSAGDFTGSGLETQLATLPLDANLNYIQQFLSALGQSTKGSEPLANPQEWFVAAYAYLQLSAENPMWFRNDASQGRVSDIIAKGQKLSDFLGSLTFSGGKINWPLYSALEGYYASNLVSFEAQVAASELQYATDNDFALDTWRQWDEAAPRVTAASTQVLGAPEIPSTGFSRWAATNIAAGETYSLALKADGTVNGWGDNTYGQTTIPAGLTNVVAIAAGYEHSLALKADGTVVAWGDNGYGDTDVPGGLTNVVAIAAGEIHSLALKADGTVVAWGDNSFGETTTPTSLSNVVAIAAAGYHSLALEADGTVAGWGDNSFGETTTSTSLTNVVAIAAGLYDSLALKADGTVVGWGDDYFGETDVPTGLSNVVAIAAGGFHTMALKADGTVVAWGENLYGETNVPTGVSDVVAIAAGYEHSLALKEDGTVAAWGQNSDRQCLVPTGLTWRGAIAAGEYHSLALRADGTVVGWGGNTSNQINIPVGLSNVVAIAAGIWHSLALKADGTVVGWGDNSAGQTNIPASLNDVVAIAAGYEHSLALTAGGTVVGWGDNSAGQTNIPASLNDVVAIAAGGWHSLALRADGTVVAWGTNSSGQTNIPIGLSNVVAIAAGGATSFALRADGTVVGWGNNNSDQTIIPGGLSNVVGIVANIFNALALRADGTVVGWGDNTYNECNVPGGLSNVVAIAASGYSGLALRADGTIVNWGLGSGQATLPAIGTNVVAIAAGGYHSLALRADGTVVGWGDNSVGQLNVPASLSNVVAITAGDYHNLALEADGTVVGWGWDQYDQTNIPAGLNDAVAIAAGYEHSVALRGDGTVVVWGDNSAGQTNIPAGLNNVVAIAAGTWHSLALTADCKVVGWGDNTYGQTTISADLNNVVAIAAGDDTSLALQADGKVVAWGYNLYNETNVPAGLSNVVAIAAGDLHCLALKADGTVVGWGDNTLGETNIPASLSNVVAIAAGMDYSLFLTITNTGGSDESQSLSFVTAEIPHRVGPLIQSCTENTFNELALSGSALDNAAVSLSGAKALLTAVLELGMPYTLERDGVLHGFLYGSESLMDTGVATNVLMTQIAQLQTNGAPQALTEVAALSYQCFSAELNTCLSNLQATGQPEIPRLVGHTLRLLDLLYDAWTPPANSPPSALEMSGPSNAPSLVLYGEPYMYYTLQYSDNLSVPVWTTTTLTNLQDEQPITPPLSGSQHRFYRVALPVP
ncbi:MAG: hypothetical protein ABSG59_14820 [Verrucomicrobiota bacterium]